DDDMAEQVAVADAADALDALAAQAEDLAGLGFGRDLEARNTVQRGDLDLAAKRGDGDADRHLAMQVIVVALEHTVFLEVHLDVEIAAGAAVDAGLTFAAETDAIAFIDTRRNFD